MSDVHLWGDWIPWPGGALPDLFPGERVRVRTRCGGMGESYWDDYRPTQWMHEPHNYKEWAAEADIIAYRRENIVSDPKVDIINIILDCHAGIGEEHG